MKLRSFIILITVLSLLIIFSACSNKPKGDISSISGSESSLVTSENIGSDSLASAWESDKDNSSGSNSKNDENSKNDTTSKTVSIIHKNPNVTTNESSHTSTNSSEPDSQVPKKLLEEVELCMPNELRFYNVKNTVFASTSYIPLDTIATGLKYYERVSASDDIMRFMDELNLNKWRSQKYTSSTLPSLSIYLSESLHINLELQNEEISWISICSPLGKVYYVVPETVYDNVLDFYLDIEQ